MRFSDSLLSEDRKTRVPRHDSDIVVAEYYYGVNCPACKKVSPIVKNARDHMHGATILKFMTDKKYDVPKSNGPHSSMNNPNVKASYDRGGIEATPTFIWSDGQKTSGGPFSTQTNEFNVLEATMYICRRAARCYLKYVNPAMGWEQQDKIIEQVFEDPHLSKQHHNRGETSFDPYGSLSKITRNY